jgi:hypothetical protein
LPSCLAAEQQLKRQPNKCVTNAIKKMTDQVQTL